MPSKQGTREKISHLLWSHHTQLATANLTPSSGRVPHPPQGLERGARQKTSEHCNLSSYQKTPPTKQKWHIPRFFLVSDYRTKTLNESPSFHLFFFFLKFPQNSLRAKQEGGELIDLQSGFTEWIPLSLPFQLQAQRNLASWQLALILLQQKEEGSAFRMTSGEVFHGILPTGGSWHQNTRHPSTQCFGCVRAVLSAHPTPVVTLAPGRVVST